MRVMCAAVFAAAAVMSGLVSTPGPVLAAYCDAHATRDANGALHNSINGQFCKATPANKNAPFAHPAGS